MAHDVLPHWDGYTSQSRKFEKFSNIKIQNPLGGVK